MVWRILISDSSRFVIILLSYFVIRSVSETLLACNFKLKSEDYYIALNNGTLASYTCLVLKVLGIFKLYYRCFDCVIFADS